MSLVGYASSEDSDDDEGFQSKLPPDNSTRSCLEASGDKALTGSCSNKSLLSSLLPPCKHSGISTSLAEAPRKNVSQPVKIIIPSLSELEDEDEESSSKRRKLGLGTGLFATLPPPQHINTKTPSRAMIPHSLTKQAPKSVQPSPKKNVTSPHVGNDSKIVQPERSDRDSKAESGEDDGYSNADFFSLSNLDKTVPSEVESASHCSDLFRSGTTTLESTSFVGHDGHDPAILSSEHTVPNVQPSYIGDCTQDPCNTLDQADASSSQIEEWDSSQYENSVPPNDFGHDTSNLESLLTDEGFLKLQGKKHRGRDIQFIDVSQEDQLPGPDWATKNLTLEQYRPRRKGNLPTSQQRRKHHITYLAFQARERELELQNQWAQNRLTKRQTQAKYGF